MQQQMFPSTCVLCRKMISIGEWSSKNPSGKGTCHVKCISISLPDSKTPNSPISSRTNPQSRLTAKFKGYQDDSGIPATSFFTPQGIIESTPRELVAPKGMSYLSFQKDGINYCLSHTNTLLADSMGLGKTVQAIGMINNAPEIRSILIVCPASLRYNWRTELTKWLSRFLVVGLWPEYSDCRNDILISSYEGLSKDDLSRKFDLIIADECQYIKNPEAKRTKAFRKIAVNIPRKLLMTGNPVENGPIELFPLLQVLDPEKWDPPGLLKGRPVPAGHGAGYKNFAVKYCDGKIVGRPIKGRGWVKVFEAKGATNVEELNKGLKESCMIRRQKSEVLKELPEKRRQIVTLPPPLDSEILKREHECFVAKGLDYEMDVDHLHRASIAFEELAKVRHETAVAKIPLVLDHCIELLKSVKKLVIFAHHKDVINGLVDGLGAYGARSYTGDHTQEMRDMTIKVFAQDDDECRVFVGSIKAGGFGLTLTAANWMVMAELDWKDMSQVEDRIHRIGQEEKVTIQYLVFDWSVDANMARKIVAKMDVADRILNK